MNTQLVEQTNEVMPMSEVLELVQAAFEADIDQNNLMCDEIERLTSENAFSKLQVKNLTGRVESVNDEKEELAKLVNEFESRFIVLAKQKDEVLINAQKQMQMLQQALNEKEQAINSRDESIVVIARYKELGSPKQIRDKNKKYQLTISNHQKAEKQRTIDTRCYLHEIKTLQVDCAKLKREALERDFQKAYSKDGDNLIIYPRLCETINQGKVEKQVPIWYATDNGIGALYMLNEDGEPARAPTPKTGIKPKAETMKVMKTMLLKFERNGGVVYAEDIKTLESM